MTACGTGGAPAAPSIRYSACGTKSKRRLAVSTVATCAGPGWPSHCKGMGTPASFGQPLWFALDLLGLDLLGLFVWLVFVVCHPFAGALEFPNALAEPFGDFRELLTAKEEHGDNEDEQ